MLAEVRRTSSCKKIKQVMRLVTIAEHELPVNVKDGCKEAGSQCALKRACICRTNVLVQEDRALYRRWHLGSVLAYVGLTSLCKRITHVSRDAATPCLALKWTSYQTLGLG